MTSEDSPNLDLGLFFREFQDFLAPKLDTYEQAIYLYVFRHSWLEGRPEATIGFKSSRRKMALGIGEKGKPMSEGTCYEKLQSLQAKKCLEVIGVVREGTKVRLRLPRDIPGLVPIEAEPSTISIEGIDFFDGAENRAAILKRENNKCFYCLRHVDDTNYVIEHVESRPGGDNSYRNVVAACRSCNNRKGSMLAEDYLRDLYRSNHLSSGDFEERQLALTKLKAGQLRPIV